MSGLGGPLSVDDQSKLAIIRKGDYLGKYGRQGSMKSRFFILSKDGQRLEFKGRGMHRIPFKSVMLVAPGRESANFKSKDGDLHKHDPLKYRLLSAVSFSVHYYDSDGFSRSLDLQCLGNTDTKASAETQYVSWFQGLSMLVQIVRAYDHIPQAILSAENAPQLSGLLNASGSLTATTSGPSPSLPGPMPATPKQDSSCGNITSGRGRSGIDREDSESIISHATQSTDVDALQRPYTAGTPGSSVSAGDSAPVGRQHPFRASGAQRTSSGAFPEADTHSIYYCGHDALGGPGAQPCTALTLVEAFQHVNTIQVVLAARSVAAIDTTGKMFMAGTTADGEHFPAATSLQGLHGHKCVQAVTAHSAVFVLSAAGKVAAWGRCASGLLGMTSRVAVFSPKVLQFITPGPSPLEVPIRFIAAGHHHCAAISDSMLLFTWGDGAYGRLGHGNMESCFEPRVVSALAQRRVTTVSCGAYHTAAVCVEASAGNLLEGEGPRGPRQLKASNSLHRRRGTMYTWGGAFDTMGASMAASNEGCLGLPALARHEGVTAPSVVDLPNVVDVACGLGFTVAVDVNGVVYQMGSMLRQGLVQGVPWEGASEPARVKGELVDVHVTHLAAGSSHVIAAARPLRDSHASEKPPSLVLTWGSNEQGQLGRSMRPPERRGNQRRDSAMSLQTKPSEHVSWLTPAPMTDIRGSAVSGIVASAESTAVVVALPKLPGTGKGSSSSSSRNRRTSDNLPSSPTSKGAGNNPAMKLLRTVRTHVAQTNRDPTAPDGTPPLVKTSPSTAASSAATSAAAVAAAAAAAAGAGAGMVALDSTMPASAWVDHVGGQADVPRLVRGLTGQVAMADGYGALEKPMTLPPPLPKATLEGMRGVVLPDDPLSVPPASVPAASRPGQRVDEEAPPPAQAYASTAEMMKRLNRGGPMRGMGAVPNPVSKGGVEQQSIGPCADEKATAINDRIAWLERVINDRNMEVSLAGADMPPSGSTHDGTADRDQWTTSSNSGRPPVYPTQDVKGGGSSSNGDGGATGGDGGVRTPGQHAFGEHDLPLAASNGHHDSLGSQKRESRGSQESLGRRQGSAGWRDEVVAAAHNTLLHAESQAEHSRGQEGPAELPMSSVALYNMNRSGGVTGHEQSAALSTMESTMSAGAQDGYFPDGSSTSGMGGTTGEVHPAGASGMDSSDMGSGADSSLGDFGVHITDHGMHFAHNAVLSSIYEAGEEVETDARLDDSEDSKPVAGTADAPQPQQPDAPAPAAGAPPSSQATNAVADIMSTASLPGAFTFLNAGKPPPAGATNPHYNLATPSSLVSTGTKSMQNDPFSNVWQQLHARQGSMQLLSLSSSHAGGPQSTVNAPPVVDNTAEVAELRMEVEKLRKELQEEKSAHKSLAARTLELRHRLAEQATGKDGASNAPSDPDMTALTARFRSLVDRNPVMVDSFWVPVDDGVSARLDVAEHTGLGKLKFSSRLFDNRAVKEWYKKNKQRVEVGTLLSTLTGSTSGGGGSSMKPDGDGRSSSKRVSEQSESVTEQ